MTKPKIKTNFCLQDIGKLFTTNGIDVWILEKYVPEPFVSFRPVTKEDGTPISIDGQYPTNTEGLVSKMGNFVRLVPEQDPPGRPKRAYNRKQEAITGTYTEYLEKQLETENNLIRGE